VVRAAFDVWSRLRCEAGLTLDAGLLIQNIILHKYNMIDGV